MEIKPRQLEIIEAAGNILTESGVNGLTTKRLAEKMGFSEAALYRHFKGKGEIILLMLAYLEKNMDDRLNACTKDTGDPLDNLKYIFNDQFDFFQKHPHFLVAIFSEGLLEESQAINQAILRLMATKRKHLLTFVQLGQEKKSINGAIPPEDLVHFIMGSFRLHMLQWRLSGFSFDVKKKGNMLMENLLGLIRLPAK